MLPLPHTSAGTEATRAYGRAMTDNPREASVHSLPEAHARPVEETLPQTQPGRWHASSSATTTEADAMGDLS